MQSPLRARVSVSKKSSAGVAGLAVQEWQSNRLLLSLEKQLTSLFACEEWSADSAINMSRRQRLLSGILCSQLVLGGEAWSAPFLSVYKKIKVNCCGAIRSCLASLPVSVYQMGSNTACARRSVSRHSYRQALLWATIKASTLSVGHSLSEVHLMVLTSGLIARDSLEITFFEC